MVEGTELKFVYNIDIFQAQEVQVDVPLRQVDGRWGQGQESHGGPERRLRGRQWVS